MFIGEATHTNFIIFGLPRSVLEPTIYHTRGEPANHYATDAVVLFKECLKINDGEQYKQREQPPLASSHDIYRLNFILYY
jgi:hypothetical protein